MIDRPRILPRVSPRPSVRPFSVSLWAARLDYRVRRIPLMGDSTDR
jgi:hypothetical protein